ncbi:DUF4286 family protein [Shewanella surugensis]|uniref:DUF4286 family protein n=1 Tax=Shewanella surugensis TaxID=212020 RepID=A0ABT0LBI9_9GAMM|nr:DUF4286 family protein [Shewanella surugensis]MCL1125072.1 DUF4286 family protein [Shewanella surugensis]
MIIYQVDLKIKNEVLVEYLSWLKPHIEKMMTFQGFLNAELCERVDLIDKGFSHFSVIYHLISEVDLQAYFDTYAKAMRDEGSKRFGDACQASRTVYRVNMSIERD